jgi:LPS-assembly protein
MNNSKKMMMGLLALIFVFGTATSYAAPNKSTASSSASKAPIVVEADELYFSDSTGDLYAKGNIQIKQNEDKIEADLLNGNTQKGEVWTDGEAQLSRPGMELTTTGMHYNLNDHSGSMQSSKGTIEKLHITSKAITTSPMQTTMTAASVTGCPAEVPDYHISADRVEIWPGDKMIAYNAKFWIKNTVIFSLPKYQSSLQKDQDSTFAFPKPSYSSDNGLGISQHVEVPFSPRLAVFADLDYYSKVNFKPMYGLISSNSNFTAKLGYGNEENSDHEWIKKEPELSLKLNSQRVGTSSLSVGASAAWGQWNEGAVRGSHSGFSVYLSNDPIVLGSKTTLKLGTGFDRNFYGYNHSNNSILHFDSLVDMNPNSRLNTWVGYSYSSNIGTTPYEFDRIDVSKEGRIGFMYQVDRLNGLGVNVRYDLEHGSTQDLDYTWRRNLHCFEADITYREKRNEIRVKVDAVKW